MKISILVFGSCNFLATLPDQIRDENAFRIELIDNFNHAIARIQVAPPDIVIVQASIDGSMELCAWLKEQAKLSWIYCILLEDRAEFLEKKIASAESDWEWETDMTAAALRQGADVYIFWLVVHGRSQISCSQIAACHRLLVAQLTVGLRKAHKYRDLVRTNDLLSAIALSDALTELNNRRALEWELPRLIQKSRQQGQYFSLIILDVDFFKIVNDTYGHLVGDRLLQLLCTRLRHNLRFQDTAFRYGGEEFVILLSNTDCDEAISVAKRLNRVVGSEPFQIDPQLSINVTISLGVACLQAEDDIKGVSLLHRADQYLLEAKALGRNRVVADESYAYKPYLHVVS
ncbi:GGDEF domain-containing protein [Calothrix sp. NIES-3974]|uniref:GGDEF domain-containing protein n=1 Tax=Calothrix sp. NIES-3974 TaxID=2005462 RepID=UPI000B5F5005|nr:GGDEF domain-containing protein [Calothrix sp. NIES-3974]BAZ06843.1 diguanylate cyclase [Calothrix sp. NIES-3974]